MSTEGGFWLFSAATAAAAFGAIGYAVALEGVIDGFEAQVAEHDATATAKFNEHEGILPKGDADIARIEEIEKQEGEYRALKSTASTELAQYRALQGGAILGAMFGGTFSSLSAAIAGLLRSLR